MALTNGSRLGAYEIVSAIGAGGMGEVYRARDTRLDRTVAIKVLREDVAGNPERRSRFEREARVLSQLTHPHICRLYDVGEHGGHPYLVLELLDGETLADRLERSQRRPFPQKDVFAIAIDIAGALSEAHRRGIVHRDLKPSNIALTKSGAKVLDFGIAKSAGTSSLQPAISRLTTSPDTLTQNGAVLGTIQYMAPEQLEGRGADARSDLFAFGAVLYEMLTGRRAFDGASQSSVIAAVLERDPPALSGLPPALSRIVQKCLAKDPEKRWQSASDLADELQWVRDLDPAAALPATPVPIRRRAVPVAAGMLIGAAVAGAGAWGILRTPAPSRIVSRFTVPLKEGQRFGASAFKLADISPDGTQMVYAAVDGLYLRSMAELDARQVLASDPRARVSNPVFSPDGRAIVFYSFAEQALKRMPVGGGTAVTLCESAPPFGISWSASGILFGQSGPTLAVRGILRVSPDGGTPEVPFAARNVNESASNPQMLPDKDTLLFTLVEGDSQDRWDRASIVALSLKSRKRTTLIEGASDGRYLSSGHLVFSRGDILYAVPFDDRQLRVTGGPVPIVEGVARSGANGSSFWSVAGNGTLMYLRGPAWSTDRRALAISDRMGNVEPLKMPPGAYQGPRLSPDGKWIAVTIDDPKEANIWIYDLAGTMPGRRLTYGGRNRFAVWSPDGRRIAFQSDRDGDVSIFAQLADGTGTAEKLTKAEPETSHFPESWSSDGAHLAFRISNPSGRISNPSGRVLMMLSLADRKVVQVDQSGSFAAFSPDGRWIAYTTAEGTAVRLVVQPFPVTGAKYQVWAEGSHPMWSRDGTQLFATSGPAFEVVTVSTRPTFAVSKPVRLPFPAVGTGPLVVNYDVMPDAQHFLILVNPDGNAVAPQIQVVLNWTDELKQLVAER